MEINTDSPGKKRDFYVSILMLLRRNLTVGVIFWIHLPRRNFSHLLPSCPIIIHPNFGFRYLSSCSAHADWALAPQASGVSGRFGISCLENASMSRANSLPKSAQKLMEISVVMIKERYLGDEEIAGAFFITSLLLSNLFRMVQTFHLTFSRWINAGLGVAKFQRA